ncbi:MAG: hypothetical protein HYZ79_08080 [Candidatus Melainabacteria bacterium]|nr:hypothetical protein [Candidatus Melainabacteria bacterium]
MSIILIVGPVFANPRGTTAEIYTTKDNEIISARPNNLTINNGQVAIILADGTTITILKDEN